jgi:hypothetical protein
MEKDKPTPKQTETEKVLAEAQRILDEAPRALLPSQEKQKLPNLNTRDLENLDAEDLLYWSA